jgi:hypothetical protein
MFASCLQSVCISYGSYRKQRMFCYSINRLVFITETQRVSRIFVYYLSEIQPLHEQISCICRTSEFLVHDVGRFTDVW